jgi:hypothetical protein
MTHRHRPAKVEGWEPPLAPNFHWNQSLDRVAPCSCGATAWYCTYCGHWHWEHADDLGDDVRYYEEEGEDA